MPQLLPTLTFLSRNFLSNELDITLLPWLRKVPPLPTVFPNTGCLWEFWRGQLHAVLNHFLNIFHGNLSPISDTFKSISLLNCQHSTLIWLQNSKPSCTSDIILMNNSAECFQKVSKERQVNDQKDNQKVVGNASVSCKTASHHCLCWLIFFSPFPWCNAQFPALKC